ncbi:uncharacterized mitochondrial protein AtMg00810-like [Lycium ferocissimum]|uniref:uncharacterized mitochondrial protein AtMg00810-like n=1 Tax=Lycium ferocissimum TaxID=112874 RepID=UPI0028166427|nr:uncharacterized mitochondrial protein AtMg00810-like [Lycium ferocissimum]
MVEKQFSKSIKVFQSDGGGEFSSIVGSLQYLTLTRPDITHAVNLASQFMQNPNSVHFQAVKRILRYVQGTISHGLCIISQSSFRLYGFSDVDWAGCATTRRSTTGYSIYLGANCVSWSSRKQNTVARSSAEAVARSSAEAEYRALAATAAELTWITYILQDIGIYLKSAPTLSKKPKHRCRIKHGSKKTYI